MRGFFHYPLLTRTFSSIIIRIGGVNDLKRANCAWNLQCCHKSLLFITAIKYSQFVKCRLHSRKPLFAPNSHRDCALKTWSMILHACIMTINFAQSATKFLDLTQETSRAYRLKFYLGARFLMRLCFKQGRSWEWSKKSPRLGQQNNSHWGSLWAIFNIVLDLDPISMFASMEHRVRVEIKVDITSNPILMHMLHRGKHRDRVKIKVDIENSPQTTSLLKSWLFQFSFQNDFSNQTWS